MWYILICRGKGQKKSQHSKALNLLEGNTTDYSSQWNALLDVQIPLTTRISHWGGIYLPVLLGTEEHLKERPWRNQAACQPPRASFDSFEFRIWKIIIPNQIPLFSEVNLYIAQALFNLLTFTICNSVYISKKLARHLLKYQTMLNRLILSAV